MAGVDVAEVAKEKKKKEAAKTLENRKRKQEAERENAYWRKVPYPRSGLSSSSTTSSEDEDGDFQGTGQQKYPGEHQQTSGSLNIEPNVGLGPRRAVRASGLERYIATAKDLGHDVSRLSFRRALSIVQGPGTGIHLTFNGKGGLQGSSSVWVFHWDGNYYRSDFEMAFRGPHCPWLRPGKNFEEILGVPVAQDGTGKKSQGRFFQGGRASRCQGADHWPFLRPTASNSGMLAGACVHLEKSPRSLPALAGMPAPTYWRLS
ncbi:hypothetical protein GWK47_037948 [Chionoecetes opilio]|uniref:Uncharacterized protein n=1 Tax=Chionoecetes opilio TaxID=41210 RepID=A0A8J4YMP1_CHIOP|nr:hypothetical protein GWK47_037948 [Chionoecetes opilio]